MVFFLKLKLNYLSKMHGYPQFSFWIPRVLTKIYVLSLDSFKPRKTIPALVSIGDWKSEHLEMRRSDVQ